MSVQRSHAKRLKLKVIVGAGFNLVYAVVAEGVLYAKKDYNLAKHPQIDVPNLQVIKLMQSFKSKEYVRETFSWQYYYWYLTNDGIEHLRNYLNLPSEIVPATLKKSARPPGRPFGSGPPGDRPRYTYSRDAPFKCMQFGIYYNVLSEHGVCVTISP
jgi:hypothetical protein